MTVRKMKSRLYLSPLVFVLERMTVCGTRMLIAMVRASCTPIQGKSAMNERMDMVYLDLRGKRFELERARLLDLPESVLL